MRKIHFADHLERELGTSLFAAGIEFIHESETIGQKLDFHLPKYDVYIEVKQFHADRISRQMASKNNVIALQGKKAVELFIDLITKH